MTELAPLRAATIVGSVESESLRFLEKIVSRAGYRTELLFLLSQVQYRRGHSQGVLSRLRLRFSLTVGFGLWLIWALLGRRREGVFIVTTNPFFAPWLVALVVSKRATVVQLLYDLYPDAIEAAIPFPAPPAQTLLARCIGGITRQTQRLVDGVVYLGPFLKLHAERRWGAARNSAVIDVGCDESYYATIDVSGRKAGLTDNDLSFPLEIHMGGQLGHMHDLPRMAAALSLAFTQYPALRSSFFIDCYASGPYLGELRRISDTVPLKILPPSPDWPKIVAGAALGLVSLSPVGAAVCLPSRVYSMLAGGLAVIAICPIWSDLAKLITEQKVGWVINNSPFSSHEELLSGDYSGQLRMARDPSAVAAELAELLLRLAAQPDEIVARRKNARAVAQERYSLLPLSESWGEFLGAVTKKS